MNSGLIAPAVFRTALYCADCGAVLQHCKGVQISQEAKSAIARQEASDIYPVAIKPCKTCIEKETGPARALKAALDSLAKEPKP